MRDLVASLIDSSFPSPPVALNIRWFVLSISWPTNLSTYAYNPSQTKPAQNKRHLGLMDASAPRWPSSPQRGWEGRPEYHGEREGEPERSHVCSRGGAA